LTNGFSHNATTATGIAWRSKTIQTPLRALFWQLIGRSHHCHPLSSHACPELPRNDFLRRGRGL